MTVIRSGPRAAAWRAPAFAVVGALAAFAAWSVLHSVTLPAFSTSMVTRALATAASLAVIVITAVVLWAWSDARAGWKPAAAETVASLAPAGLVVTSLGMPLSATRLYLDGIQVDQGFRTQFLTRMAETASNQDMNYFGLPTFYPIGWFWLGGRMANATGMSGWEVYQPWAIVSLAAAAAALTPVWRALTGSLPVAAAVSIATTAVVLTETPDEPYAAIIAMFVPAAAIAADRALRGSWWAAAGLAVYLGVSATFYTLYTAIGALTVVVLAAAFAIRGRSLAPVGRLAVIGASAVAIALVAWGPYLYNLAFGEFESRSTANHFLPVDGTTVPLPFFALSITGLLSLAGLVYLCARIRTAVAACLAVAIGVCYLWVFASMVTPVLGTSLLGFRLEVLLTLLFVTAGVLAVFEAPAVFGPLRPGVAAAGAILLAAAGLLYVQQIPKENEAHIDQAYSDTDGNGERADRFPADAGRYYGQVRQFISEHGYEPADAVVQTDEINFMAMNPYYGFNAFTSHYANPLGEFDQRNEELVSWAEGSYGDLEDPDAMLAALDASRWRAPDVFVFRGDVDDADAAYTTHVSHDIFPNEPNVRYQKLFFNPQAFDSPAWDSEQIGPFVVVVRNR